MVIEELRMRVGVVVRGEEPVEASAVAEHPESVLGLPVSGGQHEQEHAQVLGDIAGAEGRGLL